MPASTAARAIQLRRHESEIPSPQPSSQCRPLWSGGATLVAVAVTLCVLLWARAGREAQLIAYEDRVLRLVDDYGGRVVQRARSLGQVGQPLEVQLMEFPSEDALKGYMNDDRRAALSRERDDAVARADVIRVELML